MTMIPIVASADDADTAIAYGNNHPNSRWYFGKRFEALDIVDRIPEDWPETQPIVAARMPKLGTGKRFANLKGQLAKRGVNNPGALAAYIGRKKFGAKKMGQLSAHGAKAASAAPVTAAADTDEDTTIESGHGGAPSPGWLRRVRAEISEAGIDPDYVEATVPGGFASNFDGTDAVTYAEQLVEAYAESISDEFPELLEGDPTKGETDDDDQDEAPAAAGEQTFKAADTTQPAPAEAAAAPAGGMTASGAHTVNFYGGGVPEERMREIVQGELKTLLAAAPLRNPDDPDGDGDDDSVPGGPGDTDMDGGSGVPDSVPPASSDDVGEIPADASAADAGPDGGAPVGDLDAQKAKLRSRFGKGPVAAAATKAPSPGVLPDTPGSSGDSTVVDPGPQQAGDVAGAPGAVQRPKSVRNSAAMRARIAAKG